MQGGCKVKRLVSVPLLLVCCDGGSSAPARALHNAPAGEWIGRGGGLRQEAAEEVDIQLQREVDLLPHPQGTPDGSQLGGKERALSLSLECPNCKKYYRIALSLLKEWKSTRIRCRKCGNGFPIAFPAMEPPEPPQRPRALTVVRGTPVTAFRPDPPTPVSPVLPPEHPQGTPEDSSGIDLPHPPSGAGDDTPSVLHTEPPPISPPFQEAAEEVDIQLQREVDLLPHPQGTPEDSSGIDLPHPPSGAGDDTSSVPHTEEPPISPLFETDRLIGMLIKSVPHTEAPPISPPFQEAAEEVDIQLQREVDLLPHPQGTPEDSSGIDLPHPPSGAGDDPPSVLHTEEPPISPLFETDRLIGMLIKSVPNTEAPPISRPFETIKMEHLNTCSHPWNRNSRSPYWHLLVASAIVVACCLAAAVGLIWAQATRFTPM